MDLRNRTIFITGGTSGIGLELARQLLARGNTVIVSGRTPERLAEAERALPGVHTLLSDVSDAASIEAGCRELLARFPRLDVLVNNAGIMRNLDLKRGRELTDVTREIDTNLSGPVRLVQRLLPHLAGRPEALIVNVSSGLAFVPLAISPVYSATKAALHAYTQCLRAQLKNTRVAVVELAPPAVETPLFRGEFAEEVKGQRGMEARVLCERAIAGIEAGKLEIRPGLAAVLNVMSRLAPKFIFRQLAGMGNAHATPIEQLPSAAR